MTDTGAVEAAFGRIATTRMAGMPILNTALSVEVVGLRRWEDRQVCVLVTPWCINLVVLLPSGTAPLALGEHRSWRFPSGSYEFMGGSEPECGDFDFCSLYSPVDEFATQADARAVAQAVMEQLFTSPRLSRRALFSGVVDPATGPA